MCDCDSVVKAKAETAGAPEHEVEITPAMIEAGMRAITALDERYSSLEDGIAEIFIEMFRVSPYRSKCRLEG
jgi:DNA gyrase inhibitor GyrI